MLCLHRRSADSAEPPPTEPEINSIAGCLVKCAEVRQRLSSISWWMRLLILKTIDGGNSWSAVEPSAIPIMEIGEAGFAASSSVAIPVVAAANEIHTGEIPVH